MPNLRESYLFNAVINLKEKQAYFIKNVSVEFLYKIKLFQMSVGSE